MSGVTLWRYYGMATIKLSTVMNANGQNQMFPEMPPPNASEQFQKQQPLPSLPVPYKYNENVLLKEVAAYIDTTYKGHYVGDDNVQSLDLILATGHATGFNIGNILKYGSRYGKKRGYNRDDLLKVIHYALFELYNHSKVHMEQLTKGG